MLISELNLMSNRIEELENPVVPPIEVVIQPLLGEPEGTVLLNGS